MNLIEFSFANCSSNFELNPKMQPSIGINTPNAREKQKFQANII